MDRQHLAEQMAKKWFAAFNDHDLENLLSLYHDNAHHYSPKLKIRHPETNGLVTGKPALRAWWQSAFQRLSSYNIFPPRLPQMSLGYLWSIHEKWRKNQIC